MNLLAVVGFLLLGVFSVEGGRRIDVDKLMPALKAKHRIHATTKQLASIFSLHEKDDMVKVRSLKTAQGRTVERFQQTYGGLEVIGGNVVADASGDQTYTGTVTGKVISGIEEDIPDPDACKRPESLIKMLALRRERVKPKYISNFNMKRNIFVHDNGKAVLTYETSFFHNNGDVPKRPTYFFNACTMQVVYQYNKIQNKHLPRRQAEHCKHHTTSPSTSPTTQAPETTAIPLCNNPAVGEGGNLKVGKWSYGEQPFCLNATVSGSTCITENAYVKVIDLNNGVSRYNQSAARFTCSQGYNDAVNGAYSPVLDALYFGTKSARMFLEWYQKDALIFKPILYVHYSTNYENAFWDGSSLTFGDGYSYFYPLVSQDVVAHELAHGVTEQNSGLIYDRQSGGMNEAFSDITGETTKMFALGKNDWLLGGDIFKGANQALRYFQNPPNDGVSIKHVRNYYNGMGVHYSSGVFNHAFYQLVAVQSMQIKDAFDCFLRANVIYWTADSTFEAGACGVVKGCYDLGFNYTAAREAFKTVGITFSSCSAPSFIETLTESEILTDLVVSSHRHPLFLLKPPATSSGVRIITSDGVSVNLYDDIEMHRARNLNQGNKLGFSGEASPVYLKLSSSSDDDIFGVKLQVEFE